MNGLTVSYIIATTLVASTWLVDGLPCTNASKNEASGDDFLQCNCDCNNRIENDVKNTGRTKVIVPITKQHPFDLGVSWRACNPTKNISLGEVISCEGLETKMVIEFNEEGNGFVLSWAPHY